MTCTEVNPMIAYFNTNQLIDQIINSAGWNPELTERESIKRLDNQPAYTFLLRSGEGPTHYFLSYTSKDLIVTHQSVRIDKSGEGYYPNGGSYSPVNKVLYKDLQEIICIIMQCDFKDLKPIKSVDVQFN